MNIHIGFEDSPEELNRAIARYQAHLAARPDEVGTRYMLGNCLYGLGRHEEAKAEWDTILALADPHWASTVQRTLELVEPSA